MGFLDSTGSAVLRNIVKINPQILIQKRNQHPASNRHMLEVGKLLSSVRAA